MVWGAFSARGVGKLRFIDTTMDKHMYLDILKNDLMESVRMLGLEDSFYLVQDNDPKHSSYLVREWLLYNVRRKLEYPPQSPDLNVIEYLWDHMKRQLWKRNNITSKSTLKAALLEEWSRIPIETLQKLSRSMPARLMEVLNAKGGPTKY